MPDPLLIAKNATNRALPAAGARQPPRPHHRRDRHRQDGHAAGDGRAVLGDRRSGVHGRRQGRSVRHHAARQPVAEASRAPQADRRAPSPRTPASPAVFWDVFGEQGHPIRATVSDLGPLLLSRVSNLNDTQAGVLALVFKVADDNGLLLLDLKDLRAMLQHVGDHAQEFQTNYGNVSAASIGAIQRGLLALEQQGARASSSASRCSTSTTCCRPATAAAASSTFSPPTSCSMRRSSIRRCCCGCSSELYERLPEVGDRDKPKLVFFFDEAHLLFTDAPKALLDKIEQVVRLIRSKGVGVYFVTQNPLDVPETVLGQLGNRVQHALRAFTPRDQKAVKAAAETMRANPKLDTEKAITELAVGEALVSFLDEKGRPDMPSSARTCCRRRPDRSRDAGRAAARDRGVGFRGVYDKAVDRESAYERLKGRARKRRRPPAPARRPPRRQLDRFPQGFARRPRFRKRAQGQHRRSGGEERGANGRLDGRARNRPRRARIAARQPASASNVRAPPGVRHRRTCATTVAPTRAADRFRCRISRARVGTAESAWHDTLLGRVDAFASRRLHLAVLDAMLPSRDNVTC